MVLFVRPSVCPVVARVLDRKVLLVRLAAWIGIGRAQWQIWNVEVKNKLTKERTLDAVLGCTRVAGI